MRLAIYASVLLAATTPFATRWAARRLPPVRAAGLLLVSSLAAAAVWVWAVGLAAFVVVGRSDQLAQAGHWSVALIRADDPVPLYVSGLAWLAVASGVFRLVAVVRRAAPSLTAVRSLRGLPHHGRLTILPDGPPTASALPGFPGRVVVSVSLLQSLSAAERRVVLAHERCHLRSAHWLFKLAVRMAAGVAPFIRPAVAELDNALERWADESAAREVGDRRLTARAVARAALFSSPAPHGQPGVAGGHVTGRVAALLDAPPHSRWAPALLPLLVVVAALVLGVEAGRDLEALFEFAQSSAK